MICDNRTNRTERFAIRNLLSDDASDLYDILGDVETMKK